jgi:hypothetical protein
MTNLNPLFADLKNKYATALQDRQTGKEWKQQAEEKIEKAEGEIKRCRDAWMALKAVYPEINEEIDDRDTGSFGTPGHEKSFRAHEIKNMIMLTIEKLGRFSSKSQIEERMLLDFSLDGLRRGHLNLLSQTLKHMKESQNLVRAKGDNANKWTYWGFEKFTNAGRFAEGREPNDAGHIKQWDFQSGKGGTDDE